MKTNPTFSKTRRAVKALLLAFLTLLSASAAEAKGLLVFNGHLGNNYVPMCVYNGSSGMCSRSQFVIPESYLTEMTNGTITKLRFYAGADYYGTTVENVVIYLLIKNQPTISEFVDPASATTVFNGSITLSTEWVDIVLDTPCIYPGGNLLIGCDNMMNDSGSTIMFQGVQRTGSSVSGIGPIGSTLTPTQRNFCPKTAFTYTMPAPIDLSATVTPGDGTIASLSWTENGTATQWELQYGTSSDFAEGSYTSLTVTDTPSADLSSLTPETTYYARVRSVDGSNQSPWSNSTSFTPTNIPPPPANLAVSNLTIQSATLSWTAPETDLTVTGYAYQYRLASDGVWSDETTMNVTSVTLNGLTLNTTYDFRVKALYAGGDASNFETVTFITEGEIETLPQFQDFENGMGGWRVVDGYGTTGIHWNYTYSTHTFEFDRSNAPQYLISPQFDNGSSPMTVTFSYCNFIYEIYSFIAGFQVGYSTTTKDIAAFTWGDTITSSHEWQQFVEDFPGGTKYVSVKWIWGSWLVLDNFNFDTPCPPPSNVNVNVNGTDATVSWSSDADAWQLCLNDDGNYIDVNEPTYTFTNLNPCTTYTVKVRSNCGAVDGMSGWTSPRSFTTNSISAFPWTENFESFNTGTVPGDCWDNSASTSATLGNHPEYLWGVYGYGGNKMLRMNNAMVETGTALINSPMINLPSGNIVKLKFDYSHRASCGPFTVRISEDGGATFVDLASYANLGSSTSPTDPGEFTEATLILTGYAGKSVMLQFYAEADHGQGAIFVDNIEIHAYQCLPPTGLTVSDLTDHCATLSWTAPNNYVIGYSYNCVGGGDVYYNAMGTVDTNSVTFSDLTANTQYVFGVKAIYEGSVFSDYAPVLFRTMFEDDVCEGGVESLPHYQGFENGMGCWSIVDGAVSYDLPTGIFPGSGPFEDGHLFLFVPGSSPQYLISPQFDGSSAMTVSFYYFYDSYFQVGHSTTTDDVGAFIWSDSLFVDTNVNPWIPYEDTFPMGTKYVAVKKLLGYGLFLDDFSFEASWSVDGDEYTIYTATGWDLFCDALQDNDTYNHFIGKTVKLGADISVTRMAGSSGHEFSGTFDGQGHTLTVSYQNNNGTARTAPFSYINGTTIQNLIVAGSITGTASRAAGIVGETGSILSHVTNCVSSVNISGGSYTGGISVGGMVEITGCVFNGTITGTSMSGGFVGYSNSALVIRDCLFAPQEGSSIVGGTFYYNGGGEITPINSYYTMPLGTPQGIQAITNEMARPAGEAINIYDVSGITTYVNGMQYGDIFYYDPDKNFSVEGDVYTIYTATGWDFFCEALQDNDTYNRFIDKTVKLGADISVTRMAGGSYHDFMGTFDGQGHTLTVSYGSASSPIADDKAAPFVNVEVGCIIKNLHVAGDIYTSAKYAGGLVGTQYGAVGIENCHISTIIHSSTEGDGTHGGIVGLNGGGSSSSLTITGCLFDGKLLTTGTTTNCGGFVGWRSGTCTIVNSLYAPAAIAEGESEITNGSATFVRNGATALTNSYYTRTLGTEQGFPAISNPAITPVGEPTGTYPLSSLTAYVNGLMYGETFYYHPERNFQLTIAGHGTGSGGWNLLASPVADTLSPTPANGFLTNAYDLYRFNPTHEDNEWENYKADSFTLENGRGYLYANSGDVTLNFGGVPIAGNTYEITLAYDADDIQKCWNLVGNPFTCNAYLDREYYVLRSDGLGINPVAIPATTPIPPFTAVFVKAVGVGDTAVFTKVTQ